MDKNQTELITGAPAPAPMPLAPDAVRLGELRDDVLESRMTFTDERIRAFLWDAADRCEKARKFSAAAARKAAKGVA